MHTGRPTRGAVQCPMNSPHRILVVEDDAVIRRLNTKVLVDSGYEVDAAENGAVAWDALQLNGYDLVITDNKMPKVSGVDLIKKLYAAHMSLPVIMVSGTMPAEELKQSPWLQIKATLDKPYSIADLLSTVKNVLLASDGARDEITPPYWQSRQSAVGLRL
ncbi:MAG: response regulator [Verrucomicrobiales bacterium]|nr:response regulator [Verrucomicrobiales bacterium]